MARSFGDLSENSEYDEARNEQAKNEARIKELEELVENAVILDESTTDFSMASLGSTVKLSLNGGEPMEYALVSSNESNPADHKISDQSPLGAGLIDMARRATKRTSKPLRERSTSRCLKSERVRRKAFAKPVLIASEFLGAVSN